MSEHVNGTNRDQTVLFPNTIDKYVEKENPDGSSTGVNVDALFSAFMGNILRMLSARKLNG